MRVPLLASKDKGHHKTSILLQHCCQAPDLQLTQHVAIANKLTPKGGGQEAATEETWLVLQLFTQGPSWESAGHQQKCECGG